MRVLDLGAGNMKPGLWAEAEWVGVDLDPEMEPDVLADIRELPDDLGFFDHILASHVLEHLGRWEALPAIEHWATFLAEGGELHIMVPDLEWAVEQLAGGRPVPSVPTMMAIYGGQNNEWRYHKWGYTVMTLRSVIERAGLVVANVRTGPFDIDPGNGQLTTARHIYALAKQPTALQLEMLELGERVRAETRAEAGTSARGPGTGGK